MQGTRRSFDGLDSHPSTSFANSAEAASRKRPAPSVRASWNPASSRSATATSLLGSAGAAGGSSSTHSAGAGRSVAGQGGLVQGTAGTVTQSLAQSRLLLDFFLEPSLRRALDRFPKTAAAPRSLLGMAGEGGSGAGGAVSELQQLQVHAN